MCKEANRLQKGGITYDGGGYRHGNEQAGNACLHLCQSKSSLQGAKCKVTGSSNAEMRNALFGQINIG